MNEIKLPEDTKQEPKSAPVNEQTGFYFSSAIKIYDPNTEEVLVQIRGDN